MPRPVRAGISEVQHARPAAPMSWMPSTAPVRIASRHASSSSFSVKGSPTCNGFQVLCEGGLLPGALMRNECLQYRCHATHLRVESTATPFTRALQRGQLLAMPISHGEGKYHADAATLERLRERGQIVFRYATADGQVVPEANPNGSLDNIAGIASEDGRVLGLMPHPERAAEAAMGGTDGLLLFRSLLGAVVEDGVFTKR